MQYTVVVRDIAAFTAAYGSGINIAGQYVGSLSNSGEDISLDIPHPYGNSILRFSYNPAWYPAASGGGQALGIRDIPCPGRHLGQSRQLASRFAQLGNECRQPTTLL